MLVCSVVVQQRNVSITADIVETGAALDTTDFVTLFGTLVDSPGNALDIVNAVVGQLIVEPAAAADIVTVAPSYRITILEDTTARDAVGGLIIPKHVVTGAMVETATATSTQDATGVSGAVPRQAMTDSVFVNSDGTVRQGNTNGTMVNL